MNDIMIDLETLGTSVDTVVISIGAVFFDTTTKELGPTFNMNLKIENQLKTRSINADTLAWWMGQSNAAKKVFSAEALPTVVALSAFVKWVIANAPEDGNVKPWGNGAIFDISILEHLLAEYNIKPPWKFSNVRDLRTFKEYVAGNAKINKLGIEHNALDDAMSQAQYVMENIK